MPGDDRPGRLAPQRVPPLPSRCRSSRAPTSRRTRGWGCRAGSRCSTRSRGPGTSAARRSARAAGASPSDCVVARCSSRPGSPFARTCFDAAVEALRGQFDRAHGGFGGAPKFPPASALEFLLRRGEREMTTHTLRAMASGGMYDQVGGGFARYSVDALWLVPHFEKMLYDNALLARVYLHGWQVTGDELFRTVAEETLDWALREAARPRGRLPLGTRRGLRGRGGQVLRLDRRGDARGPGRRARRRRGDRLVRRHRPRQLRGPQHPGARSRRARAPRRMAPPPLRGAREACLARP